MEAKRKTKVIGVSVDSVQDHEKSAFRWTSVAATTEGRNGSATSRPLPGGSPGRFPDHRRHQSLTVAKAYDMLPADFYLPAEGRTPASRPRCARSISSGRTRRCG
jgi:hypothetical protein